MVSLAYLISLLSVLVAVSRAADVTATKSDDLESKWFGNYGYGWNVYNGFSMSLYSGFNNWWGLGGNCYGAATFPLRMGVYFAKANEEAHSVSRRAIRLDAEQLFRRDSPKTVSCLSDKGVAHEFSTANCAKAVQTLQEKNVHKATSGDCTVSLITSKDKVYAKQLPDQTLHKALDSILKNCGKQASEAKSTKPPHVDENQVVMVLSQA